MTNTIAGSMSVAGVCFTRASRAGYASPTNPNDPMMHFVGQRHIATSWKPLSGALTDISLFTITTLEIRSST